MSGQDYGYGVVLLTLLCSILLPLGMAYLFQPVLLSTSTSLRTRELPLEQKNSNGKLQESTIPTQIQPKNAPTHMLSIVIPSYNEEQRLPLMLKATLAFLTQHRQDIANLIHSILSTTDNDHKNNKNNTKQLSSTFEIVIVDDGSTDQTLTVARQLGLQHAKSHPQDQFRLVQLVQNSGKGAAVQCGMLASHAHLVLMADADGATDIADVLKLVKHMVALHQYCHKYNKEKEGTGEEGIPPLVVIGSRAHLQESSSVQRSALRTLLMHGFHFFVALLCPTSSLTLPTRTNSNASSSSSSSSSNNNHDKATKVPIRDTQCGFKLFSHPASQLIFQNLHLRRWAFDIELLTLCNVLQIPVQEVGVTWQEVDGSKLDEGGSKLALALVSLGMLRDMVCVKLCYGLGIWRVREKGSSAS